MKIAVAGTGYVGLSMATLLAQRHQVTAVDVLPERVGLVNSRKSTVRDDLIEEYLRSRDLSLRATLDARSAYRDAEVVVVATPTNYDPKKNFFDTSSVDQVIAMVLEVNPGAVIVIKSTVPVGFTRSARKRFSWRERLPDGSFREETPRILSHRSSSVSPRPFTTTSTRAASSSVTTGTGREDRCVRRPHFSLRC